MRWPWQAPKRKRREYRDVTFDGGRVVIDDATFTGCTFNGTTVVYRGTGDTSIRVCHFNEITLELEGGAAATVKLLRLLRRTPPDGQEWVDNFLREAVGEEPRDE